MKTIIGQAATDEYFFIRKKLVNKFWTKIENGNNILLSAPRRIGKTSLMLYFEDHPNQSFHPIYIITESVNNENEFYRKIFKKLFNELNKGQRFLKSLGQIVKQNKLTSIGIDGSFSIEEKEINYHNEILTLIKSIELEGTKILLMIDEFAQTVENIKLDEEDSKAIHFLESNRELRMDPTISAKLQFVYAGSIGLENVVSLLNSMSTINDLYPLKVPPFNKKEAQDYIQTIPLSTCNYNFSEVCIEYLNEKIKWLIPFYINILLDEIDEICFDDDRSEVTTEVIDLAFENSLLKRNYFEHWHTRLRIAYRNENYSFSKEILNIIAEQNEIDKNQILNIAVKYNLEDKYKDLINSLVYDGYISNQADKYYFNSPLLKEWWKRNVAN